MRNNLLIDLVHRAVAQGYSFTIADAEEVAERIVKVQGIKDLRTLAAYVFRLRSDQIPFLVGLYADSRRMPGPVRHGTIPLSPPIAQRDLGAMFCIDMSDLSVAGREKMKAFYYAHGLDSRGRENLAGKLFSLNYCCSPAHIRAIEGLLDSTNTDIIGFRARLLRVLLANAADIRSYDFTLRETGAVHDWKEEETRSVILVDDPAVLQAGGEMAPILRERIDADIPVAVSLPGIYADGATLSGEFGELDITSEYSIAAPDDAGFPNGTYPDGLAGDALAMVVPLGTSGSPDTGDPLLDGGTALTNVLPLVRR